MVPIIAMGLSTLFEGYRWSAAGRGRRRAGARRDAPGAGRRGGRLRPLPDAASHCRTRHHDHAPAVRVEARRGAWPSTPSPCAPASGPTDDRRRSLPPTARARSCDIRYNCIAVIAKPSGSRAASSPNASASLSWIADDAVEDEAAGQAGDDGEQRPEEGRRQRDRRHRGRPIARRIAPGGAASPTIGTIGKAGKRPSATDRGSSFWMWYELIVAHLVAHHRLDPGRGSTG